jgi:UDP-hydrolysing UDP-N-acetyl-D-glucosamine 2-epimerase
MIMNKKRVAYISGTRADFGLMSPVLRAISNSKKMNLTIYATGMHLMKEFGYSYKLIHKEFKSVKKINTTFTKDNELGMANFISSFLQQITNSLSKDRPDFVLTLGDRPEMLATAIACNYLHIPTGQLHGGEKTSTIDEISRHAITKLSHLHFPATKESAERILKMGEESWRIHVVGAPSLDVILHQQLPSKRQLERKLGLKKFLKKPILVTLHPISNDWRQASWQMQQTLNAVKTIERDIIIVYPNADSGGRSMIRKIQSYKKLKNFHIFSNIEYKYFLALEREAAVWVGNSSGAIIESPSFNLPVINIGPRQVGRQRATNVIDVPYNTNQISAAVKRALTDKKFLKQVRLTKNPWGDGKTAKRVASILEKLVINEKLLNKKLTYA